MKLIRPFLQVFLAFIFYPLCSFAANPCGELILRPDAPGEVKVKVSRGGYEKYYQMSKDEDALYNNHLKGILNIILDQSYLKPPHGVELRGWLRNWTTSSCPKGPCLGVPIAGQGVFLYHVLLDFKGKAVPIIASDIETNFSINDLEEALGHYQSFDQDSQGRRIAILPDLIGNVNGAALFRIPGHMTERIIITRNNKPWWLPVSKEEFLKIRIRDLEKEIAKLSRVSRTPSADVYQKWLKERPQREKDSLETYKQLKKNNPALADKIREQNLKLEADMTERFRQECEREAEKGPSQVKLTGYDSLLKQYRETLESMSHEDRSTPAYYKRNAPPLELELAPAGSPNTSPLVVINKDYFDKSLPRTAIQIIAVIISASWVVDPNWINSCEGQHPAILLKYEVSTKTDWGAIRSKIMK
jgi:hypothetical protein